MNKTETGLEKTASTGCDPLTSDDSSLTFTLVVPALNEEEAIAGTLERALAARTQIISGTQVKEVRIVLVNDGSTDRTQEIADRYAEVTKVRFEKNRGYGAALMAGFDAIDSDIVGFMDGDGTCDPAFFIALINELVRTKSDIVVGSRMNAESEMPFVRRLGNFIFAQLIGVVSGQKITDSASGMRVIRRSSLKLMQPLPSGMHFTPAMTCLALLDSRLQIREVAMPYKERVGESKLRVIKDGFRFLFIILFTTALFNPLKSLCFLGAVFLCAGAACAGLLVRAGENPLVVTALAGAFVVVFLQAAFVGFLCHQVLHMLLGPWRTPSLPNTVLRKYFWTVKMVWSGVGMLLASGVFYGFSLLFHSWERTALGLFSAFLVIAAGWTALGGVVLRLIWAAKQRRIAELELNA